MKQRIQLLFGLFLALGFASGVNAQCTGGTSFGSITPTTTFQTIPCIRGGQYYTFNAVAGTSYTFSCCSGGGSSSFDSQLTILTNAGAVATPIGYSDDVCGSAPEINGWTCSATGTYRILLNNYFCVTGTTCATVAYRENPPIGPGGTCATAFNIPSLPFTQTGSTTCGYGDDYSSLDACGSSYMNGDDFVYAYNSPGNESVTITLTNTGTYVGVFLLNGCPNVGGTVCMPLSGGGSGCTASGATNESFSGNPFGTWNIVTPGTYYIVISTFPSPQCTPFDINITRVAGGAGGSPPVGCYTQSAIAYAPESYTTGTLVTFPDDEFSSVLPIGFQFCFMGTTYTDFVVSSNGFISFNTLCANQYSTYVTQAVPSATVPSANNSIMVCWQDIDPSVAGDIRYRLMGTAPNRRLIVIFENIAMFSSVCNSQTFNGQIKLYETTNIAEILIGNKSICSTWNSGNAVQGIVAPGGAWATTTTGRNNTNWTANNEAFRFTPSVAGCCILDADYTSISGASKGTYNLLNWQTQSEEDVQEFVLERSMFGNSFEEVARQDAQGSASTGASYELRDPQPFSPVTYYRVRDIGIDGQSNYSEVISVVSQGTAFSIDHVAQGEDGSVVVGITAAQAYAGLQLEVLDATGRSIGMRRLDVQPGVQEISIPMQILSPGYYLLQVNDGRSRSVKKFLVH
jgi:hypothetical protein